MIGRRQMLIGERLISKPLSLPCLFRKLKRQLLVGVAENLIYHYRFSLNSIQFELSVLSQLSSSFSLFHNYWLMSPSVIFGKMKLMLSPEANKSSNY